MCEYQICLDSAAARFYEAVAAQTGKRPEEVLADALFKLAGELALEALAKNRN